MNAAPKVQDSSMEEILASIRRIIADDQDGAGPAPGLVGPDREGSGPAGPTPLARREPVREEAAVREPEEPADPRPTSPAAPATPAAASPGPDRLLSDAAQNSAAGALRLLSTTVLNANPHTLDDLVAEMLRPMLKSWLDENLPSLVERLVRSEIDRITRPTR
jgi:cell pole-organizing protein PopZ